MNTADLIGLLEKEIEKFGGWKLAVASDYTDESDFPAVTEVVTKMEADHDEITLTLSSGEDAVRAEDFLSWLKTIQMNWGEASLKIKWPPEADVTSAASLGMGSIKEVRFFINEIQLVI